MYRPALIIGLGGTGVLTLHHLKASLLASQEAQTGSKRELPRQIKIIALDTVKSESESAETSGDLQIEALRTELEAGEYFWIGGDVYDFVRDVDRGKHPHISSWFQASSYLQALPRAAFTLERGAGQLRQFGRLALFYDVSAPARSSIYSLLSRAMGEIRKTGTISTLDVFLVSSVAGGTGAGMFVDVAYLVRQIADIDQQLSIRLRGFLVLPEAFNAIPGGVKPSMRSRAFACMRENKRFMVDFQYEHGYPMYYHASGQGGIWRSEIKTKLFDFLYHVDGRSQRNPLTNQLPEYGVTAGIADAIAAMLDKAQESEEDVYDRHTTNVVAQATQLGLTVEDEKTTSFDSAIGAYTLALPMHHIIQWLAYRLSRQSLEALFPASKRDEDGYVIALASDANAENPGVRGKDVAVRLLDAGEVQSLHSGERVSGTPFFREVLRVAQALRPQDKAIVVELSNREAKEWEEHLDPPGATSDINAVRQRVQQEFNQRLMDDVPPNQRGESASAALDRILRGVEKYKGFHLGREDMRTGQRVGGQYRAALEEYVKIQLERYRLMLEIESENILNGGQNPDDPSSVKRGGKLGYLIDWLKGLEAIYGRFLQAMQEARTDREERQDKQDRVEAAQDAKHALEDKPGGIFGGRRRQAYLQAEQEIIDLEKTMIAEDVVTELVKNMLEHTQQLRENAEAWANMFVIGYDSLYGHLLRGERKIEDAIKMESKVPVRKFFWDQSYLDDLYAKYARDLQSGVDVQLDRFTWLHEHQRKGLSDIYGFRVAIKVSEDEEKNRMGMDNRERSLDLLLTPAREVFATVWDQESILKYLMTREFPNANDLGDLLAEKTDVWLSANAQTVVPANYLHVAHGTDPAERDYLEAVRKRLTDKTKAKGKLNDTVNSSDRFTLRLIYTLDLIPLESVQSYTGAENAYWTHGAEVEGNRDIRGNLGRETLHLFPAEVNAARLETRIPQALDMPARALHNDIVLQMENMDDFRLFVRCWAFDVVRQEREEGVGGGYENFWILDLPPEETGSVRGPEPAKQIHLTRAVAGQDPDLVEAMKNWNFERRDVRPGKQTPIDYDRARRAVKAARDAIIAKMKAGGQGIEQANIRDRVERLPQREQERFLNMWLERQYLQERQEELRHSIFSSRASLVEQDAAIAMFLIIDDDIDSLNMSMDDLLRRGAR